MPDGFNTTTGLVRNSNVMRGFLVFILILSGVVSRSQNLPDSSIGDIEWGEGTVMLADNTEIKGLLRFDEKRELLAYEGGKDSRTFTPRKIIGFEYHDNRVDRQRVYFSFPYHNTETGEDTNGFFEVLRQYTLFSVLTRKSPVTVRKKQAVTQAPNTDPLYGTTIWNQDAIILEQLETIFLMNDTGSLTAFLEITQKEVERVLLDRSVVKTKLIDKKLLRNFVGSYYDQLISYAKERDWHLDVKEDLLQLLDYYESISDN